MQVDGAAVSKREVNNPVGQIKLVHDLPVSWCGIT